MFTGREYESEFREICHRLAGQANSKEEIESALIGLEWTLWEAVRGAIFVGSSAFGILAVIAGAYLFDFNPRQSWTSGGLTLGLVIALGSIVYAMMRLALFSELTRHVRTRKFGELEALESRPHKDV